MAQYYYYLYGLLLVFWGKRIIFFFADSALNLLYMASVFRTVAIFVIIFYAQPVFYA
jgi:hypothetical protein